MHCSSWCTRTPSNKCAFSCPCCTLLQLALLQPQREGTKMPCASQQRCAKSYQARKLSVSHCHGALHSKEFGAETTSTICMSLLLMNCCWQFITFGSCPSMRASALQSPVVEVHSSSNVAGHLLLQRLPFKCKPFRWFRKHSV